VCGPCHVEYYCGPKATLLFPWDRGLRADDIEARYDATRLDGERFSDWTHAETGAKVLEAQHPEFELWSQGVHARAGVACADCHMPYVRERGRDEEERPLGAQPAAPDRARVSAVPSARRVGALTPARELQRKAQWRLDFVNAENSMGFLADQESARLLAEAIDHARQPQLAAVNPWAGRARPLVGPSG
jgi:nitrite reductase (cytochrome c-552)